MSEPSIVERTEQPYLGIRRQVTMSTIPEIADRLPALIGWLLARGDELAGPPFLKYAVFHQTGGMEIEAGVPVAAGVAGGELDGEQVVAGVLPGGRFASVTHLGRPDGLMDATAALLDWGSERGLTWDTTSTADTESWGLRMELYKTDPAVLGDLDKWETEIVFRLAD